MVVLRTSAHAFQNSFRISVFGKVYNVVKIDYRTLDFYDMKGNRVRDPDLRRKLALTAWVHERLIGPSILAVPGYDDIQSNIDNIRDILNVHAGAFRYSMAQKLLVTVGTEVFVTWITGGSIASLQVAGYITADTFRKSFETADLKGLLRICTIQTLNKAQEKYKQIEERLSQLKGPLDYKNARIIFKDYLSAFKLSIPSERFIVCLLPKHYSDLVYEALKDAGDAALSTFIPEKVPLKTWANALFKSLTVIGHCKAFMASREGKRLALAFSDSSKKLIERWATYQAYEAESQGIPSALVTSGLTLDQRPPYYVGQKITARFTIANEGSRSITFKRLLVGGREPGGKVKDFTPYIVTLRPGESYNYQGSLLLDKPGHYHFFIAYQTPDGRWNTSVPAKSGMIRTVDIKVLPRRIVRSSRRATYSQAAPQRGALPDLTISLDMPGGWTYKAGQRNVEIRVTVRKTGGNLLTTFYNPFIKVALYWSEDKIWDAKDDYCWDYELYSPDLAYLNAHGSKTIISTINIPRLAADAWDKMWGLGLEPGTHYLLAVVDPDNTVRESNESNNVKAYTLHVTK